MDVRLVAARSRIATDVALGRQPAPRAVRRVLHSMAGSAPPATAGRGAPSSSDDQLQATVHHALRHSPYYADRLRGVRAKHVTVTDLPAQVPITTRADAQRAGDQMWAIDPPPVLCVTSSGTTGRPLAVPFTEGDVTTAALLGGMAAAASRRVRAGDRVMIGGNLAGIGPHVFARTCTDIGAQVYPASSADGEHLLQLARHHRIDVISLPTSLLAAIVTAGERMRDVAAAMAVRQIFVGGDIVTSGLLRRARAAFGPRVTISEGWGCTETYPLAGGACGDGHIHFDPRTALVELVDLDGDRPVDGATMARLVITPYSTFRRGMPLLRYDTGDIVEPVIGANCDMSELVGIVPHGRRTHAVRLRDGAIVTTRHVQEVLEGVDGMGLPVRLGLAPASSGCAVHVALQTPTHLCAHDTAEVMARFRAAHLPVASLGPPPAGERRRVDATCAIAPTPRTSPADGGGPRRDIWSADDGRTAACRAGVSVPERG